MAAITGTRHIILFIFYFWSAAITGTRHIILFIFYFWSSG